MIHKLPPLRNAVRYTGLYIFDFGEHVSVGYTAEEIEYLLSEAEYAQGRVYKIQRARADGTLEIRGVNPASLSRTTGIVFWFAEQTAARAAAGKLHRGAEAIPPPGVIDLTVCHRSGQELAYAVVIRYVHELDGAVAAWLLELDYQAGLIVEAGSSSVQQAVLGADVIAHELLPPAEGLRPRSREEVLSSVHFAVQR